MNELDYDQNDDFEVRSEPNPHTGEKPKANTNRPP